MAMPDFKKDYYKMLEVEPTATADEIKKAYRVVAMKYHPDRNPGDKVAEEKFKEAADAYGFLENATQKMIYDRMRFSTATLQKYSETPVPDDDEDSGAVSRFRKAFNKYAPIVQDKVEEYAPIIKEKVQQAAQQGFNRLKSFFKKK